MRQTKENKCITLYLKWPLFIGIVITLFATHNVGEERDFKEQ